MAVRLMTMPLLTSNRRGQRADARHRGVHGLRQPAAAPAPAAPAGRRRARRLRPAASATPAATAGRRRTAAQAVPRRLITVPWRMFTCTAGASSMRTIVGRGCPDGDAHRVAQRARQLADQGRGQAHRVVLLQADQPQLHRQRPQAVAARLRFLLDQPPACRSSPGKGAPWPRSCRPRAPGPSAPSAGPGAPRTQQLAADLHALDAALQPRRGLGFEFLQEGGHA